MRWDDFYKQAGIRVQCSEDKEISCKEITKELLLKCETLKDNSTKYHFKLMRRHLRNMGITFYRSVLENYTSVSLLLKIVELRHEWRSQSS